MVKIGVQLRVQRACLQVRRGGAGQQGLHVCHVLHDIHGHLLRALQRLLILLCCRAWTQWQGQHRHLRHSHAVLQLLTLLRLHRLAHQEVLASVSTGLSASADSSLVTTYRTYNGHAGTTSFNGTEAGTNLT